MTASHSATAKKGKAVWENGASRHRGGPIQGPLWLLGQSQHYLIEEFKGGPYLVLHYAERRQSLEQSIRFFFLSDHIPSAKVFPENDTFNLVIAIMMNWLTSVCTTIAATLFVRMCQFTRLATISWNVSFM